MTRTFLLWFKRCLYGVMVCVLLIMQNAAMALEVDVSAITVASTTRMSGQFFTNMWGNNTADIDVRQVLHDYQTIAWTSKGAVTLNDTAVKRLEDRVVEGGHEYTITIHPDLTYNDGTPITAKDYVFSVLILSSPVIKEIGGNITSMSYLQGYDDYTKDVGLPFSGIRLVDDYTFTLIVDAVHLPYYYELALLAVVPYPISVIAPGCQVVDEGDGAKIEGSMTAELLRETILNEKTGYLSHPKLTSGAYQLDAYDAQTATASFSRNPYYKGNYEKQKPTIDQIIFTEIANDAILGKLKNGEVDIVNKVTNGAVINEAKSAMNSRQIAAKDYARSGLSFIAYSCEQGWLQSDRLRRAIGYTIDAQSLCDAFLQGNGEPVHGYYGLGLWIAQELESQLGELQTYSLDLGKAERLLVADGWLLNAQGEPFREATDKQRYREQDGQLIPLALRMAVPADNEAAQIAISMLQESFAKLGITLQVDEMAMPELLNHYYRHVDREYDMFFLASNFTHIFDPYYTFNTEEEYQGIINTSGLKDEKLMGLALEMRETDRRDTQGYLQRWMAFQKRFNEVLPLLPLYSNTYYDLYNPQIKNYDPDNSWSWSVAILYAALSW